MERLRPDASRFGPRALSLRRPSFEVVVVTVLVVALFFQRLDHYLWLERNFPIPDLTFVLAGLLVVAYAAVRAYRRQLDLRHPSRVELTVVALFVVLGLTAAAAALSAQAPSKSASTSSPRTTIIGSAHRYDVKAQNARIVQLGNARSGFFLHLTPKKRKPAVLGYRLAKGPVPIDRLRSYTYSVTLKTTSKRVPVSVVLKQWSPGSKTRPAEVTKRVKVGPSHWVHVVVSAEPAPGQRVLEPFVELPRRHRTTTLLLAYAQLTSDRRVPLAIPAMSGARYNLRSQGVDVRQHASGLSGWWTIVARSVRGRRGVVRFLPSARTLPVQHKHVYEFTVLLRAASGIHTLTVGLRRSPTSPGAKPFETKKPVTVRSTAWTRATLAMQAAPGKVLEPFIAFPRSGPRTKFHISFARLTRRPSPPRAVLASHLGQSVKTIAHFAYLALIALLLGRILTPALMRRAFATFFVLAVAASVLAVLQAVDLNLLHSGASQTLHLVSRGHSGFIRPCSIFSEPALLGYFALLGVLVGLRLHAGWQTRWLWVGMGLCLLAILLAAAAGPIVALVPVALYLAWRANRLWRRFWRELTALAVVGIAVLVFLPAGKTLTTRANSIISGSDHSAQFRYAYDSASVRMWELSPLTGVGLGNTRFYYPSLVHFKFDTQLNAQSAQFQSVNSYLGTLSESGVFGLLMLATMLVALFWPLGARRRDDAWVTEAAILLFIVAFFFVSAFSYPIFWFWVGARLAQLHWQAEPESVEARAPRGGLQPDAAR